MSKCLIYTICCPGRGNRIFLPSITGCDPTAYHVPGCASVTAPPVRFISSLADATALRTCSQLIRPAALFASDEKVRRCCCFLSAVVKPSAVPKFALGETRPEVNEFDVGMPLLPLREAWIDCNELILLLAP